MDATAKAPADFSLRRYGAPADSTLEGFLFPATYELRDSASSATLRQPPARRLPLELRQGRHDRRAASQPRRLRRPHHRLDGRARGARREGAPDHRVGHPEPLRDSRSASTRRSATRRTTGPSRSRERAEARLALQHAPAPRAAADADRQPGARVDQGGREPGHRDYLFYVVKPGTCGQHAFSRSDAQFEKDVAAYNAARAGERRQVPDEVLSASASSAGPSPTAARRPCTAPPWPRAGLRLELPAAAGPARAVRGDGPRARRRRFPRGERDDPAQGGRARDRRRRLRLGAGDRRGEHAQLRRGRRDPRRQHRRAGPARRHRGATRETARGARGGRERPRRRSGRCARPARTCRSGTARAERAAGARRRGPARRRALPAADLLVNCTSVGLGDPSKTFKQLPISPDAIGTYPTLVDLVYRPGGTALELAARERGVTVVGGLEILVRQGAHSFAAWTGTSPDLAVMRAAVLDPP